MSAMTAGGSLPAEVEAPAKLTVSLRITGVHPDGYHELDAEMVSLDLCDVLELDPGSGLTVVDELPGDLRIGTMATGGANLITRALRAVGADAAVRLRKRIPVGAGLGGGSSDAAAVLRWARCHDLGVAAGIGADVPFCLAGGRARVGGVGEIVEPLPFVDRCFMLLLAPFGVDTAAAYRAWDAGHRPEPTDGDANHLEAAAIAVEPRLGRWRSVLAESTGYRPRLAGSGSTWFVEVDGGEEPPLSGIVEVDGERGVLVMARTRRAHDERG